MLHSRILIALILVFVCLATFVIARPDKTSEKFKLVNSLQGVVEDLLRGNSLPKIASSVDIEAYLIDGVYFESLPGVLKGESTHCKLVEGKDAKIASTSLVINDDENAAYEVVTTQTPGIGKRVHSVVFFKTAGDTWKVKSWHISH